MSKEDETKTGKKRLYVGSRRRAIMQHLRHVGIAQVHQIAYSIGGSPCTVYDDLVAMKNESTPLVDSFRTQVRVPTGPAPDRDYQDVTVRVWRLTDAGARRHSDVVTVPGSELLATNLETARFSQRGATLRHDLLVVEHLMRLEHLSYEIVHERAIRATEKPETKRRFQESEASWETRVAQALFWAAPARGRIETSPATGTIRSTPSEEIVHFVPDGGFVLRYRKKDGSTGVRHFAIEVETSPKAPERYRARVLAARGAGLASVTSRHNGLLYFCDSAELRRTIVRAITVKVEDPMSRMYAPLAEGAWVDGAEGGTWKSTDGTIVIRPLMTDLVADVPAREIPKTPTVREHPLGLSIVERPRSLARTWEVRPDMTARATDQAVQAKAKATRAARLAAKKATAVGGGAPEVVPAAPAPRVTQGSAERVEARTYLATVIDQANAAARDGLDVTGLRVPIDALKRVIAIGDDLEALSEARHAVAAAMVSIAEQKAAAKVATRRRRGALAAPAAQVTAPAGKPVSSSELTDLKVLARQQVLARHGRLLGEGEAFPSDLLVEVATEIRRLTSTPKAA